VPAALPLLATALAGFGLLVAPRAPPDLITFLDDEKPRHFAGAFPFHAPGCA
jgi:hypothetical protein